jgi:hypothetical protein
MRIGVARNDGVAMKIDHARFVAFQFFSIFIQADECDPINVTATASACGCFSLTV